MVNKYSFNIGWSDEDQEYVATCPGFPGLSALGETEDEALAEAKTALGLFIQACQEKGIQLPEPQVVDGYSGQFRVRLPKSLHREAAQLAADDGMSLNQLVISAVEAKVGAKQMGVRMLSEMKQALREHASQLKVAFASAVSSDDRITTVETNEFSSAKTQVVVTGRFGKDN
jgi:predicted RNase H-like HicB family nuclease